MGLHEDMRPGEECARSVCAWRVEGSVTQQEHPRPQRGWRPHRAFPPSAVPTDPRPQDSCLSFLKGGRPSVQNQEQKRNLWPETLPQSEFSPGGF